jgi:NADH:ubiquinone oxidoreductase subunit 6 (subunit J)
MLQLAHLLSVDSVVTHPFAQPANAGPTRPSMGHASRQTSQLSTTLSTSYTRQVRVALTIMLQGIVVVVLLSRWH